CLQTGGSRTTAPPAGGLLLLYSKPALPQAFDFPYIERPGGIPAPTWGSGPPAPSFRQPGLSRLASAPVHGHAHGAAIRRENGSTGASRRAHAWPGWGIDCAPPPAVMAVPRSPRPAARHGTGAPSAPAQAAADVQPPAPTAGWWCSAPFPAAAPRC